MNNSETPTTGSAYLGHVKNGVVILDNMQVSLQEGQAVRVEPLNPAADSTLDADRQERILQLQQLFAQWDEEDAQLTDEEADRLHIALEQSRGMQFRSPALD